MRNENMFTHTAVILLFGSYKTHTKNSRIADPRYDVPGTCDGRKSVCGLSPKNAYK